jgi:hypothetical protein
LTCLHRAIVLFQAPASAAISGINPFILRVANATIFANWPLNPL